MAKTGRNNPCPCGSGKKHKHCCYGKALRPPTIDDAWIQDPAWYKIRLTEGDMVHAILGFAVEQYGKGFLREALEEFGIWGEFEVDEMHVETIFMPWVAFSWTHEVSESGPSGLVITEQPLGLWYLDEHATPLDDYEQRFIRTACTQPFSFFAVSDVVAGKSLGLRDVFLDRTFTVKESKASKTLSPGDIIFAKI